MPFNVAGGNISKIAYENAKEAMEKSDEAKTTAEEAKELSESVISGEVDIGVTRTKIDERLSALEEQYAPKLTEVTTQLAQTAKDLEQRGLNSSKFSSIQDAVDATPIGGTLILPKNEYSFDSIQITKPITIDLQNSVVTGANTNKSIFEINGIESATKYLLDVEANRNDKKIFLTATPNDVSVGDLIVLTDDTVRVFDGNPDMNVEIHEVAGTDPIEKSIVLRDFVRLPKNKSSIKNVYKITPVSNVRIKNGTLKLAEGSTSGNGIRADITKHLELTNIKTERMAGSSVFVKRSFDFYLQRFDFSNPQVTGSGQGYGVQLFAGVNKFTIRDGFGKSLRHTISCNSAFDGFVGNVIAVDNVSSQFVISHNGWTSDITFHSCRSFGGRTYGFQISSQGVSNPFTLTHYGIRIIDCEVQLNQESNLHQQAIRFDTPIKESTVRGFKGVYGDGTSLNSSELTQGISMKPIDNDITLDDIVLIGFRDGIRLYHPEDVTTADPSAIVRLRDIYIINTVDAFVNSYGQEKRVVVENVTVDNASGSIFRFAEGSFKSIKISDVRIVNSPNASVFFTQPVAHSSGIFGEITNFSSENIPKGVLTVIGSQKLTRNQMYLNAQGNRLPIQSNSEITLSPYPIEDGIVEGQVFSLLNLGSFNISVHDTSKLKTKTGTTRVIQPKESLTIQWFDGAWREI